ncbi:DUF7594 domain-containing protein [Paenibacillus sacheonensis]|uniref:Carbohydrate-binding module family 96 domain-containing protein n=1 Tax=Paenibacillus sacheonensis TaxID=742054 RepID=A0A7X4YSU8_9BACL|nr:hypothetical protein [Paenibacillus sacheonensis]MBM7569492.1 hypothetical protein [Paenibacillus sacheonensis]NBC71918.1 hypothetical protein [Paenibacillus sacheonensis]
MFVLKPTANVTNAKVRIYHTAHANAHTLIANSASTENWNEGGVKPTLGSQLGSASVSANGYVEIDVTAAVQAKISGGQSSFTCRTS